MIDGAGRLPEQVTLNRFNLRRALLDQFDSVRRNADAASAVRAYSGSQQRALALLTSPKVHEALDVTREKDTLRNHYGMTLFGQSCLAARRLGEACS